MSTTNVCTTFTSNPQTVTVSINVPSNVSYGVTVTVNGGIAMALPATMTANANSALSLVYACSGYSTTSQSVPSVGSAPTYTVPQVTMTGIATLIQNGTITFNPTPTAGSATVVTIPVKNSGTGTFAAGTAGSLTLDGQPYSLTLSTALAANGTANITQTVNIVNSGSISACLSLY